jgi:hypothetical protein
MLSLFHLPSLVVVVPVVVITGYQVVVVGMLQEVIQWHLWLLVDFILPILEPLENHICPHSIMSKTG